MENIAIVGVGNFGSALRQLLGKHELALWDNDVTKVPNQLSLEETVKNASIIFLCVSSWSLRKAAESLVEHVAPGVVIVCPTKGIEQETLKTSDEVLQEIFGEKAHITLLHGPMLAAEIAQDLPAFSVLASKEKSVFDRISTLFSGTNLQLEYSSDVHGVALAGVLKNIYSIGLGMTEALELGSNFRGWFVRVAMQEMSHIISSLGGTNTTAYTSAGIADMVATGFSPYSRNCQVGHEIVQSGECITVSEGAESLPQMMQLLERSATSAPIVFRISQIISGKASPKTLSEIVNIIA